jgi:hypothetical protein
VAKKSEGFDLGQYDFGAAADRGADMQLRDPVSSELIFGKDGKPVTITLAGQDSEAYRKAERAASNRRLSMKFGKRITAEELEGEVIDTLARCTLAWSGIVSAGEGVACNHGAAVKLYSAHRWIREQVEGFVAARENFTPGSSKT